MNSEEIAGSFLGIIGTVLLSTKLSARREWRFRVFLIYAFSNIFLVTYFTYTKQWFVFGMVSVYFLTSINGMWNNRSILDERQKTN